MCGKESGDPIINSLMTETKDSLSENMEKESRASEHLAQIQAGAPVETKLGLQESLGDSKLYNK